MKSLRVWINYRPRLYMDLFKRAFEAIGQIEVVKLNELLTSSTERGFIGWENVDLVIMSLNQQGQPDLELIPDPLPDVKIIAFSPRGDYGLRHVIGGLNWEEIRPFGWNQLVCELTTAVKNDFIPRTELNPTNNL
jgi:hypothetical protein